MCLTRNQKVVSSNPGLTTALCVLEQDTLTDLLQWSQPYIYKYQLLLGANLRWIIVPSRGVIDFHPLNTTETGDKLRPYESLGSGKDLAISWHSTKHFESQVGTYLAWHSIGTFESVPLVWINTFIHQLCRRNVYVPRRVRQDFEICAGFALS